MCEWFVILSYGDSVEKMFYGFFEICEVLILMLLVMVI